jgi:serine/threonine protein kinase
VLGNGRYYIGRALGQGGFGITYLGWDNDRAERVAIKEYFPLSLVTRNPGDQSVSFAGEEARADFNYGLVRFMDEARVLASFASTPSIVSISDVFQEHSLAYMVMEYLDGQDLKHVLSGSGRRISPESARNVALHIAAALRDVHAQGLMHRDVSPDNIFITKDGEIKLIDFGAARFAFGTQNKSLSVVLKPSYAPVEQYQTRGNQGPWTDIYALGATLYRCVTGQLPPESLSRLEEDKLKPPSELGIALPKAMEAAILKALAVRAKDRFQSVQEFSDALLGATPQPQTIAAAPERTQRLVTERAPAPPEQTTALNEGDLSYPYAKAKSADWERETVAAPALTERLDAEAAKTTRVPQTIRAERVEEKRASGAKKWIALAVVILIIVSSGAFWTYTTMYGKSETPVIGQPISTPDPEPEPTHSQNPPASIPQPRPELPVSKPPKSEPTPEPPQSLPAPISQPRPEPSVPEPPKSPTAPDPNELYRQGKAHLDSGDRGKAEQLLEQAADLGHAKAMSALGFLHVQGDQRKSFEWYHKAVAAGDNDAVMPLAQFYYHGNTVAKDYKTAAGLLRPLADAGNANAKIMLYNIFTIGGYGIEANPKEAEKYR